MDLVSLFESISSFLEGSPDNPFYAVMPVPNYTSFFVGKDTESYACVLISTADGLEKHRAPIRLENLDVQFRLRCRLREKQEPERKGTFAVIRCRSLDRETIRYFFTICETILRMLGDMPTQSAVASAVHRLASIFQKIQKLPSRPVSGLFGELYLISRSGDPAKAVMAWRMDEMARFDFAHGDVRLDVKATAARVRAHMFSYEQCNPPSGTIAVVASLLVERIPGGVELSSLIDAIEERISCHSELIFKLHEVVAATLGASLHEALALKFDIQLADSSLRFFSLRDVPAIHGPLPPEISDVHFRSDLSAVRPLSIKMLINRDPIFSDLLPRSDKE